MDSLKVAVMMGGWSAERGVSLISGNRILKALHEEGIEAEEFDPSVRDFTELQNRFDKVYVALHGRGGEDGTLQGALELMGIPYTGSGVLGSAVAMDKVKTRYIWQALGLPVASAAVLNKSTFNMSDADGIIEKFGLPLIVKPAQEGSSMGTLMVENEKALRNAIQNAFLFGDIILVEQFIVGREFSVCILNDDVLPPLEIKLKEGSKYFCTEVKADKNKFEISCPAQLDPEQDTKIRKLVKEAFLAIGCSNYGRVDILMDHEGRFYLLEVNTAPGMTPGSILPQAAEAMGLSLSALILEVLKGASLELKNK